MLFRICAVLCNFYPRPPRGGRPTSLPSTTPASSFLSTPSARRATILATLLTYALRNFYPRPPRGGRPGALVCKISSGAISIHALREEGDVEIIIPQSVQKISIHALREEGDVRLKNKATGGKDFYPRPPRGGRPAVAVSVTSIFLFLSTPSARRATIIFSRVFGNGGISIHALREEGDTSVLPGPSAPDNFYPRPPRGGRPGNTSLSISLTSISIHALREEGDSAVAVSVTSIFLFLSTPSARRATGIRRDEGGDGGFLSTPSARRATSGSVPPRTTFRFLSTPSARRATSYILNGTRSGEFLSTPSARRATDVRLADTSNTYISIHALREEGDPLKKAYQEREKGFLSTPSARRATPDGQCIYLSDDISIHALREEGDASCTTCWSVQGNFYPRPPRGGRPGCWSAESC